MKPGSNVSKIARRSRHSATHRQRPRRLAWAAHRVGLGAYATAERASIKTYSRAATEDAPKAALATRLAPWRRHRRGPRRRPRGWQWWGHHVTRSGIPPARGVDPIVEDGPGRRKAAESKQRLEHAPPGGTGAELPGRCIEPSWVHRVLLGCVRDGVVGRWLTRG